MDAAEGVEWELEGLGVEAGHGGFAGAGRAVEEEGDGLRGADDVGEGAALAGEMLLAGDISECLGAEPLIEGFIHATPGFRSRRRGS